MTERIQQIIRQFPENGMKLLLQQPDNARELHALAAAPQLDRIDFARMEVDPTTYVSADFRHVSSDLVLRVPFRQERGSKRRTFLMLTILIEHQSAPDRLMILRVLDYLVQIWKAQVRAWGKEHGSLANVHLQPILPIVFYTGLHRWERVGELLDLMVGAEAFRPVTPEFAPLFVNLPETPAEHLTEVGYFGRVLQLVQARKSGARRFSQMLREVLGTLEGMVADDLLRWQEMLSYLHALVYHDRDKAEQAELLKRIETSARTDELRQEMIMARKSMAEEHLEEGALKASQRILLRQLRARFGVVPPEVEQAIQGTQEAPLLDEWLDRVVTATTLAEIGIVGEGI